MATSTTLDRKQLKRMLATQLIYFKFKKNVISGENELFNENKNITENFRNIQKKFDLLAGNYEKLHSKIIIAEKMTSTL